MEEMMLMDATERYLRGQMSPEEVTWFDQLRNTNSDVDQMVVEHSLFIQQFEKYGRNRNFRHTLHETHQHLLHTQAILPDELSNGTKVINFWKRYKRTISIAASIAGITALSISAIMLAVAPKSNRQIQELGKKVDHLEKIQKQQNAQISIVNSKLAPGTEIKGGGSAFLINEKGLLVTNAHVLRNAKGILVANNKGKEFKAEILSIDTDKDLALIKIDDAEFQALNNIPYSIRKSSTDIAEPIFTLGYPRNEIVYGEGYLSAKTGFNGDTLSCQVAVAANPGNSGGPVFNRNGEVIGVLSTKDTDAEGVVFAIKAKYIHQMINELNQQENSASSIKISNRAALRGMDKVSQVKRIQDFVFMVKVY